jgi:NTP pyrophosphatase (non-canonical NTP hydrolase)
MNKSEEYQEFCKQSNWCSKSLNRDHLLFGLSAEVGEVLALFQKQLRDLGKPHTQRNNIVDLVKRDTLEDNLKLELGDVLWHLTELAREYNWTLEDLMESNIDKLRGRHGI